MSWALFIDTDGKAKVDFYCFARKGRIISEHAERDGEDGANAALAAYRLREQREALRVAGQQELPL